MAFLVKYQQVPFNYNTPSILKIEAPSERDAWAVAFDKLVVYGMTVDTTDSGIKKTLSSNEDVEYLRSTGIPSMNGRIHILEIHSYEPKLVGSVLSD
jgi:hypothetical protein